MKKPSPFIQRMSEDVTKSKAETPAQVKNALLVEFDIGANDLTVLRNYCREFCDDKIDIRNLENIREITLDQFETKWTVKDDNKDVNDVLTKVKNIGQILSVRAKNFKHLLHALDATPADTMEDLDKTIASYATNSLTTSKMKVENGIMRLVKGFHVTNVLSCRRYFGPRDQITIDAVRRIVEALVAPVNALARAKNLIAEHKEDQLNFKQVRYNNERIIANLVTVHAVTLNCAEYFHGSHCEDSYEFYKKRKKFVL